MTIIAHQRSEINMFEVKKTEIGPVDLMNFGLSSYDSTISPSGVVLKRPRKVGSKERDVLVLDETFFEDRYGKSSGYETELMNDITSGFIDGIYEQSILSGNVSINILMGYTYRLVIYPEP